MADFECNPTLTVPCFFCGREEATGVIGKKWDVPAPLKKGIGFLLCKACCRLSTDELAEHIFSHVKNLREIHNRKVLAARETARERRN